MMKIILREELIKDGIEPTVKRLIGFYNDPIDWSIPYEGWQPEAWKEQEFNMLLFLPKGDLLQVKGTDFDYVSQTRTVVWEGGKK